MTNELYDCILNMNIDSETVTGVFTDEDHDAFKIVEKITAAANAEHNVNCEKDKNCKGVLPYLLKHIKIQLTSHQEYTPDFILAIIAAGFVSIGDQMHKTHKNKPTPDKLDSLLKKLFREDNVEVKSIDFTDFKEE